MLLINYLRKLPGVSFVYSNKTCLALFFYFLVCGLYAQGPINNTGAIQNALVIASGIDFKNLEKEDYQILVKRAELADTELLVQKRKFQICIFLGVAIVLGLISYVVISQNQMRAIQFRKENELKAALITIDNQNRLQEQRLRMSRDLNDSIARQLNTVISSIDNVKFNLDSKDNQLNLKLSAITDFTTATIDDFREAIWAMNAEQITLTDIRLRILNFADPVGLYASDIRFSFHIAEHVDATKLSSLQGLNLIKAMQEGIKNSLAHANSTVIEVEISKTIHNINIRILDNGRGFNLDTAKKGNGLKSMEKYMHSIGGALRINTSNSKGTELIFMI